MDDLFDAVVVKAAGITESHPLARVLVGRRELIELTEKSCEAVLRPEAPGGLHPAERAALACRISRLNGDDALAAHYERMMRGCADETSSAQIAEPEFAGGGDARLTAVLRHVDLVTLTPREAAAEDVAALRAVGIPEADIVRLSQLVAFLSYQTRVAQGLRLMMEAS